MEAANDAATAEAFLAAFLAQREARARDGLPNAYRSPPSIQFLRRLAGLDAPRFSPKLRLWALTCSQDIVATFGALTTGAHVSGVLTSFALEERFARHSPGELLLHDVIRLVCAEGKTSLDLGVGEARYKRELCENEVELVEAQIPLSRLGAAYALTQRLRLTAKRRFKASPAAMAAL